MSDDVGHGGVYRRRRAEGATGWFVEDIDYESRWLPLISQACPRDTSPVEAVCWRWAAVRAI